MVAGVLGPTSGRVTMGGEDITGLPRSLFHELLRTFQVAHEFSSMSCRENLMMVPAGQSVKHCGTHGLDASALQTKNALRASSSSFRVLTISRLAEYKAGQVSGGSEKAVGIRPHHDGRCKNRLFGRGRRRREPNPAEYHRGYDHPPEPRTWLS